MKNFVVYKSSAGSGKTFTLVKEFLRLSLHDEKKLHSNFKRILAVTFTNKAAAEMKHRVITALSQLSSSQNSGALATILLADLNITGKELKRRSALLLKYILHNYSDLSIGTIDSFNHRIVKTFAHDLQLPVNFNIELDTKGFYDKVISLLFAKIGEDEYISNLLKEFALGKARDNSSWDPERSIREFAELLQKENSGAYIEKLRAYPSHELEGFRIQFIDFIKFYKSNISAQGKIAVNLIIKQGLEDEDFYYKKTGPQRFFYKCAEGTAIIEDAKGSRISDALNNGKWEGNSGNNIEKVKALAPQLNGIATGLVDFISENYQYFSLCEILSKQMYPLMLLKKIEEISEEQKQEERLVFISEFNQKIFEIITSEPTPFIYERLGVRYQHYLLDEFQDTSSLQWQNMLPLIENSLSSGWFNLIVGDGKQSIYRWRNANVRQFSELPAVDNPTGSPVLAERSLSLQRNFKQDELTTNFRSSINIVNFNNELFASLSEDLLKGEDKAVYDNHSQVIAGNTDGLVTVNTCETSKEELDAHTRTQIQKHISEAIDAGYNYKDICVLSRKNDDGNNIAKFLIDLNIPIVSSDSLLIKHSFEVNTLLCFLNYLVNKEDIISAASVLNFLRQTQKINKNDFHKLLNQVSEGQNLFEILKTIGIHIDEREMLFNNLFDNCISIINALELSKVNYVYIRFFLDEVNEFLSQHNSSLSSFFDWWEIRSKKASAIIPENTNAVRIMTIHASKGLEFPVVIVPYCNWSTYRKGEAWVDVRNEKVKLPVSVISLTKKAEESGFEKEVQKEQQDQILDNVNLIYVAFTRAIDRLHVISQKVEGSSKQNVAVWIKDFLEKKHAHELSGYYVIGNDKSKIGKQSESKINSKKLDPLAFTTPKDVIRIKASYLYNNESSAEALEQGLLLHWLLSKIITREDIGRVLREACLRGEIANNQIASLENKITSVLDEPLISSYFNKQSDCRLEAELLTSEGEVLRPDRVVFNEKETVIMDYKTGKANISQHSKQLLKYEQALQFMGYTGIKKFLLYLDEGKVVQLN